MPPLICPSPILLDQSFPRDEEQLRRVAEALGELQLLLEDGVVQLVLTSALQEFVSIFNFEGPYPLLLEIYRLLDQWFLQPHEDLIRADVSSVGESLPHPVPSGCSDEGLITYWSDEVGKLLVLHDHCAAPGTFFIGIACSNAFAGHPLGTYDGPADVRAFPLVGPTEVMALHDAYTWHVRPDYAAQSVSFRDVQRNYSAIGAISFDPPSGGGSHYKVKFRGGRGRTWVVDKNYKEVPEQYLRELIEITGYPVLAIKAALIAGKLPHRVIRLRPCL